MKVYVNPHNLLIEKKPINEKEINITKCEFEFPLEITDEFVKEAYFTLNGHTYKQIIVNNECDIPSEVLQEKGSVELGVVAYLVEGLTEIKRYNPSPAYFDTWKGSLKEAENSEPITPSEFEQYEQALNDGLIEAQRVDIEASKTGHEATVTVTRRDGTQKIVNIFDGEKGEKGDRGDRGQDGYTPIKGVDYFTPEDIASLNIPSKTSQLQNDSGFINKNVNDLTNYTKSSDLSNVATSGSYNDLSNKPDLSNYITKEVDDLTNYYKKTETYTQTEIDTKLTAVYKYKGTVSTYADLPSTGLTIGDVYNVESDGSNYAWTGSEWDKLGGTIDLTNYVQKTDYATTSTGGVIKPSGDFGTYVDSSTGKLMGQGKTYEVYRTANNNLVISKATLENVITGKGLVSNTDYASSSTGGVIKLDTTYGTSLNQYKLIAMGYTYAQYQNASVNAFISKYTLENVLTAQIGNIDSVLDAINNEVI